MAEFYQLRSINESDIQLIFNWRNSEKVRTHMFNDQLIEWDEHRQWFEKALNNQRGIYRIFLAGGNPAGLVNFTNIDVKSRSCFWGFYIGVLGLPKGTGLIMGSLGLDLAFTELSIRKVSGECFSTNKSSIKFHERLGFQREGCFVQHCLRNGIYEDIIRYALFKEDWSEKRLSIMN